MSIADRDKWDAKYAGRETPASTPADEWLIECVSGLPPGRAMDFACGLGHNAIWLAGEGWQVDAVDVSPVGLQLARASAERTNVESVSWIAADLDEFRPTAAYDLIVVFRFLDRRRLPGLIETAMRPAGRLVYETFLSAECERDGTHIRNPAFTLAAGELPRLYSGFESLDYRERTFDNRTVAQFVAEKPAGPSNQR